MGGCCERMVRLGESDVGFLGAERLGVLEMVAERLGFGEVGKGLPAASEHGLVKRGEEIEEVGGQVCTQRLKGYQGPEVRVP